MVVVRIQFLRGVGLRGWFLEVYWLEAALSSLQCGLSYICSIKEYRLQRQERQSPSKMESLKRCPMTLPYSVH